MGSSQRSGRGAGIGTPRRSDRRAPTRPKPVGGARDASGEERSRRSLGTRGQERGEPIETMRAKPSPGSAPASDSAGGGRPAAEQHASHAADFDSAALRRWHACRGGRREPMASDRRASRRRRARSAQGHRRRGDGLQRQRHREQEGHDKARNARHRQSLVDRKIGEARRSRRRALRRTAAAPRRRGRRRQPAARTTGMTPTLKRNSATAAATPISADGHSKRRPRTLPATARGRRRTPRG